MSERWKPKHGELYYYISTTGVVTPEKFNEYDAGKTARCFCGNCFRTAVEAESAAEKFKAFLLSLHDSEASIANSETLKGTFIEYLKKCAEIQSDVILQKAKEHRLSEQYHNGPEETMLPDWCKVDVIGWHKRCGYFKVTYINTVSKRVDIQQVEDKSKGYLSFHTVCTEATQARLCPYNEDEMRALVGKVVGNEHGNMFLVTAFVAGDGGDVCVDGIVYNADDLLKYYTINGSPCGVLEHLNENREWVQ